MEERDATLRRVGRNIANLQLLESAVRCLLPTLRVSGTLKEIREQVAGHNKRLKKLGLGELSSTLHATLFNEAAHQALPDEVTEPMLSISLRIEGSGPFEKAFRKRWRKLVAHRNKLVHSLLLDYDLNDERACTELSMALDAQNKEVCALLEYLGLLATQRADDLQAALEQIRSTFVPAATPAKVQDDA